MATTLSQFYSNKGISLPKTVKERFSLPGFKEAAAKAGFSESNYAINSKNAAANVSILNNLLKSSKTPVVQTSNQAYDKTNQAINKLTNTQNKLSVVPKKEKKVSTENKLDTSFLEDKDPLQEQADQISLNAERQLRSASNLFDSMAATLDSNSNSLIQSIKEKYAARIEDMRQLNQASLAGKRVMGIVSGRERYAQEIQSDILTSEETAGLERIADLESEERSLIIDAQNAADGKKMQLLVQRMNQMDEINKQKKDAIADLYKNAMEFEKLSIQRSQEQRQQIKDRISNAENIASNLAAALTDSFTGDSKTDNALIDQAAAEYGIDPNFLQQAIAEYKRSEAQAMPGDIREYQWAIDNGVYKGSYFDYLKTKKTATSVAKTGGAQVTKEDLKRYGFPEELLGRTEKDIAEDLLVSNPPTWFEKYLISSGQTNMVSSQEDIRSLWDDFRKNPDLATFINQYDLFKNSKSEQEVLFGDNENPFPVD